MAQRSTPNMVSLEDFGKRGEIPAAPINWTRRAIIGGSIAVLTGGAFWGLTYLQRTSGQKLDQEALKKAASGKRGVMTLP